MKAEFRDATARTGAQYLSTFITFVTALTLSALPRIALAEVEIVPAEVKWSHMAANGELFDSEFGATEDACEVATQLLAESNITVNSCTHVIDFHNPPEPVLDEDASTYTLLGDIQIDSSAGEILWIVSQHAICPPDKPELSIEDWSQFLFNCTGCDEEDKENKPPEFINGNTARWYSEEECPVDYKQAASCDALQGVGQNWSVGADVKACTTGSVLYQSNDFQSAHGSLTNTYSSNRAADGGDGWEPSGNMSVNVLESADYGIIVALSFSDGGRLLFIGDSDQASVLHSSAEKYGVLVRAGGQWKWINVKQDELTFNANGKLSSHLQHDGLLTEYVDSTSEDGQSEYRDVIGPFGQEYRMVYANGQLQRIIAPDNTETQYSYDNAGRLTEVEYPDGSSKQYLYEDIRFPNHLTGVIDENGDRFLSISYDDQGRVFSSERANGANRTHFTYPNTDNVRVRAFQSDEQYSESHFTVATMFGSARLLDEQRQICPECSPQQRSMEYDNLGQLRASYDYQGNVTTFGDYDATRGLELSRTEASGTADARTISTTWHPEWVLPTLISNGQQEVHFTYDDNGRLQSRETKDVQSGESSVSSYTWTSLGKLASVNGTRTDVNDITQYGYDTQGNLISVTNALGHVTTLSNYDANGRVGQVTDPNGLITKFTYTTRGWLKTRTVGSLTTTFGYDKVGQLTKLTRPDGSFIRYEYDAAHRLVAIENTLGERIEYSLDFAGNRIKEEIKDALGNVVFRQSSEFNALNQLVNTLNAANEITTSYTYDANGNQTAITRNTDFDSAISEYEYDPLNRLKTITDALNGVTALHYDHLDQLSRVTDPKGLNTQYSVSALGELKQIDSPDTAVSTQTFDRAGNLKSQTNARGHTTTYSYDALNRLTKTTYHDGSTVVLTYDTGTYGKGKLAKFVDSSGSTTYVYDSYGRLEKKTQSTSGISRVTTYSYDNVGRMQSMKYPSGKTVAYSYDTNGQIEAVKVSGVTQLKNIKYQPFSAVKNWQWANNSNHQRHFNLDGQLQSYPLGTDTVTLTYDRAGRILAQTHTQVVSRSQSYEYDLLDRLTDNNGAFDIGFSYDANGNRLSKTDGSASEHYTISQTSNRIETITGNLNRHYQYDAAGNTLSDGERSYTYNTANRLATITKGGVSQQNYYNGLGQRVRKNVSGSNTLYVYDEAGRIIGEYKSDGTLINEVVYLGDTPVLALRSSGNFYIQADQLNTPRALLNATGTVVWRWDSEAFGSKLANEDPDGNGAILRFHLRFPGQVHDAETGVLYNWHRYYDASIGRYISSDPIGLAGKLNTYAYASNNPINRFDLMGLSDCSCQKTSWGDRFKQNWNTTSDTIDSGLASALHVDLPFGPQTYMNLALGGLAASNYGGATPLQETVRYISGRINAPASQFRLYPRFDVARVGMTSLTNGIAVNAAWYVGRAVGNAGYTTFEHFWYGDGCE